VSQGLDSLASQPLAEALHAGTGPTLSPKLPWRTGSSRTRQQEPHRWSAKEPSEAPLYTHWTAGVSRIGEPACRVLLDIDQAARQVLAVEPALLLEGARPRLLDEWPVAPEL
jgi:hypothetical protein